MRLTTREASIVGKIQESSYCINELVDLFNVSNKTIKNDINNINNKISNYDSSIDIIDGHLVFKSIYSSIPWKNIIKLNRSIEEEDLICLKLLFKKDYIAMNDFAAELYISKSKLEKSFM